MLELDVISAVVNAEAFLLKHQDADGLWRDYDLAPGRSEAWTTACVGWVLAYPPACADAVLPLRRATDALHLIRKPDGWGYNRHTSCDADSTAWVWRLLAALDDHRGAPAVPTLCAFLSEDGAARTFRFADRFGSWASPHSDVTPMVGLALLAVGAERQVVQLVRHAVLESRVPGSGWKSYWWATDCYATAQSLEFLSASGSIPSAICRDLKEWLHTAEQYRSPLEAAQFLAIAVSIGLSGAAISAKLVNDLLSRRMSDGAWQSSAVLLVPEQRKAGKSKDPVANPDTERLMSTAMVTWALKKWLLSRNSEGPA